MRKELVELIKIPNKGDFLKIIIPTLAGLLILHQTGAVPLPLPNITVPEIQTDFTQLEVFLSQIGQYLSLLPLPLQRIMAGSTLATLSGLLIRKSNDKNWKDPTAIRKNVVSGALLGATLSTGWGELLPSSVPSFVQPSLTGILFLTGAVIESNLIGGIRTLLHRNPSAAAPNIPTTSSSSPLTHH